MDVKEFAEKVENGKCGFSECIAELFDGVVLERAKIRKYLDAAYLNTYDRAVMEFHADYSLLFVNPLLAFKTFRVNLPLPKNQPSIHIPTDTYYLAFRMSVQNKKQLALTYVEGVPTITLRCRNRTVVRLISNNSKVDVLSVGRKVLETCYITAKDFVSNCKAD